MYRSTKTYGHERGMSCSFRQWRAETSHCRFIHGYALAFRFEFEAKTLDARNWVVDFGGLNALERKLKATFDHKLLVAEDDPHLDYIASLGAFDAADVLVLRNVGCEAFARLAWGFATEIIRANPEYVTRGVRVVSCEISEHGANSAIYFWGPK